MVVGNDKNKSDNTQNKLLNSFVWVKLKTPEDFLKIKETLSRIGIASKKDNTLYQSCHILHKQGKYAIVHFKELFALDGKPTDITQDDLGRRNTIASLLVDWGLATLENPNSIVSPRAPMSQIKILHYDEKDDWKLICKYQVGRKI